MHNSKYRSSSRNNVLSDARSRNSQIVATSRNSNRSKPSGSTLVLVLMILEAYQLVFRPRSTQVLQVVSPSYMLQVVPPRSLTPPHLVGTFSFLADFLGFGIMLNTAISRSYWRVASLIFTYFLGRIGIMFIAAISS